MTDVVEALLEKSKRYAIKDYVDVVDDVGNTPLHYAAMNGHEEVMMALLKAGANNWATNTTQMLRPWEMMDRKNTDYSSEVISAMTTDNRRVAKLDSDLLLLTVALNSENQVKDFCAVRSCFKNPEKLIEIANKNGNTNLAFYINFFAAIYSLIDEFNLSLFNKYATDEEKNKFYLDFLKKLANALVKHNQAKETQQYNFDGILKLANLIAICVNQISYKFRENSYELIPWQNLEFLRFTLMQIPENKEFKGLLYHNIKELCESFVVLDKNLEMLNDDDSLKKPAKPLDQGKIKGMQGLYTATDLIAYLRVLQKIARFSILVDKIDVVKPFSPDRLALITMIKQIGEFSKHSQQCSNLSPAIKKMFDEVPWKILEELRDYLAKAATRKDMAPIYHDLLNNPNEEKLTKIKADIADISFKFIEVYARILEEIKEKGWQEVAKKYSVSHQGRDNLSKEQKDKLLADMQAESDALVKKAQKEKKNKIITNLRKYLEGGDGNFEEIKQEIFGNFFKGDEQLQKEWVAIFQGRSGVFKGLEDLFDQFANAKKAPVSDYKARSEIIIDKILEILIGDDEKIEQLKKTPWLKFSEVAGMADFIGVKVVEFNNSRIKQMAVEHLYAELWLLRNELGQDKQLCAANTHLRNFLEHQNSIYETTDKLLSQANYIEILGITLEVLQGGNTGAIPLQYVSAAEVVALQEKLVAHRVS